MRTQRQLLTVAACYSGAAGSQSAQLQCSSVVECVVECVVGCVTECMVECVVKCVFECMVGCMIECVVECMVKCVIKCMIECVVNCRFQFEKVAVMNRSQQAPELLSKKV